MRLLKGLRFRIKKAVNSTDNFIFPAVLYPVSKEMRVYNEEQFGPLVPVKPFSNINEIIDEISDSKYGTANQFCLENDPHELSPLIDIHYLLNTLNKVARIEVIALRNEVKEVLVIQEPYSTIDEVEIRCVNLESEDPILSFTNRELSASEVSYSSPKSYLYIPNNALLKSGAF